MLHGKSQTKVGSFGGTLWLRKPPYTINSIDYYCIVTINYWLFIETMNYQLAPIIHINLSDSRGSSGFQLFYELSYIYIYTIFNDHMCLSEFSDFMIWFLYIIYDIMAVVLWMFLWLFHPPSHRLWRDLPRSSPWSSP